MRELIRAFGIAVQWFCWALAAYVLFRLWLLPDGYPVWLYIGTLLLLFALVKAGTALAAFATSPRSKTAQTHD